MVIDTEKPQSNTQRALAALKNMILTGELAAGSDHLESELAERLGMSRTPVREAALTLESQGLLELRPRKGMRILSVSPADMAEIYDVLTELECLSARQAAERHLTAEECAPLARSIEDMDRALRQDALDDWADADERFHRELVHLGGNSRIMLISEMMSNQVRRARTVTLHLRPKPSQSNEDHRQVLEAIQDGRGDDAAALHRSHRQKSKALLVGLLEKHRLSWV